MTIPEKTFLPPRKWINLTINSMTNKIFLSLISACILFLAISVSVSGQTYPDKFGELMKTPENSAAIESLLTEWQKNDPKDYLFYHSYLYFYFEKSRKKSTEAPETQKTITDENGKITARIANGYEYNEALLQKGIKCIENGITTLPSLMNLYPTYLQALYYAGMYDQYEESASKFIDRVFKDKQVWYNDKVQISNPGYLCKTTIYNHLQEMTYLNPCPANTMINVIGKINTYLPKDTFGMKYLGYSHYIRAQAIKNDSVKQRAEYTMAATQYLNYLRLVPEDYYIHYYTALIYSNLKQNMIAYSFADKASRVKDNLELSDYGYLLRRQIREEIEKNYNSNGSVEKEYSTVTIGNKTWMKENLNVTTFSNGDAIPFAATAAEWNLASKNKKPAWCYNSKKGVLYNYYAVIDPRGLAPKGFRVPTVYEWKDLEKIAGQAENLKSNAIWDKNPGGNNSLNFSALPNGKREASGEIRSEKILAAFWTSSIIDPNYAWSLSMTEYASILMDKASWQGEGLSVRCIKL